MIIEYSEKYQDDVKRLLLELQEYIASIDKEGYNIVTDDFQDKYFDEMMDEVKDKSGKILLYQEDNSIVGVIVGSIHNEEEQSYGFHAPKRGKVDELIVSKHCRSHGYGKILLEAMEEYLKSIGCKDILIEVFGYNDLGKYFYEKNGYHLRMMEMTKTDI